MLTRGLAGSLLVLLGGLVVSTLPASSPVLDADVLVALRAHPAGRMLGLAVVLTGLGLLAASWLRLCRRVALPHGESTADRLALVRHACVVWSAPLVLAPPLFSRDGWSYAAQGTLAHLGLSPYDHGPSVLSGPVVEAVDPMWLDTPAPYGPLPLALGDLAAAHTGNPWVLVVAHRGVALVGLLLLAWAVPRLARWSGVDPALASAVVLVSPLMLANGVGGLHNDLLMVGLMAAALVVAAEHGWAAGAVLGGLAAAVKVPGGLVCLGVVLVGLPAAAGALERVRRAAAVAGVAVGTLVGLGAVTGLGLGWVAALGVPGTVSTPLSTTTLVGGALDRVAGLVGLGPGPLDLVDVLRTAGTLAALLLGLWALLRRPAGDRASAVATVALVVGATVVLGPVVHLWYFLWAAPFLAVLRLDRLGMVALLAASTVLGLVAPLDSSLHGAYLAIVLGCLLVAALLPVLLLTRRARARLGRIAHASPARAPARGAGPASGAQPEAGATVPRTSPSVIRPPVVDGAE